MIKKFLAVVALFVGTSACFAQASPNAYFQPGGTIGSGLAYCGSIGGFPTFCPTTGKTLGTAIASATTIAPVAGITHITGTTPIATITVPAGFVSGTIILIPDGIFTTTTAGNIALASTAVVSKALSMTYDATAAKWYPSY